MRRILIFILTLLILSALCLACAPTPVETTPATESAASATEPQATETEEATDNPLPQPTLGIVIETIPAPTDDADYHLPPGERPTLEPEIR